MIRIRQCAYLKGNSVGCRHDPLDLSRQGLLKAHVEMQFRAGGDGSGVEEKRGENAWARDRGFGSVVLSTFRY